MTALYGGRFDPPHSSHRSVAEGLFTTPGIKNVIVIPCGNPAHRPTVTDASERLILAQHTFAGLENVYVDDFEVEAAKNNPHRPSYTYDTIRHFSAQLNECAFVIGSDQLEFFHLWYRFEELLTLCHWIVLERAGFADTEIHIASLVAIGRIVYEEGNTYHIQGCKRILKVCPTIAPAMSATEIRHSIAITGDAPKNSLIPSVESYVRAHGFYGMNPSP